MPLLFRNEFGDIDEAADKASVSFKIMCALCYRYNVLEGSTLDIMDSAVLPCEHCSTGLYVGNCVRLQLQRKIASAVSDGIGGVWVCAAPTGGGGLGGAAPGCGALNTGDAAACFRCAAANPVDSRCKKAGAKVEFRLLPGSEPQRGVVERFDATDGCCVVLLDDGAASEAAAAAYPPAANTTAAVAASTAEPRAPLRCKPEQLQLALEAGLPEALTIMGGVGYSHFNGLYERTRRVQNGKPVYRQRTRPEPGTKPGVPMGYLYYCDESEWWFVHNSKWLDSGGSIKRVAVVRIFELELSCVGVFFFLCCAFSLMQLSTACSRARVF